MALRLIGKRVVAPVLVLALLVDCVAAGFGESTTEEKEAKQQRKQFNAEVRSAAQPHGVSGLKSITRFGDDIALFNGDDGVHGYELWRSDLTTEGTKLVLDINAGAEDSCEQHSSHTLKHHILHTRIVLAQIRPT